MKVNVIIVNWNSSAVLQLCLDSILKTEGCSIRIIIVDNGSTPNEISMLRKTISQLNDNRIHVIYESENRGYAGGNNIGYKVIREGGMPGHVLILNPDTTVKRNTVAILAAALANDVGIVTPRVTDDRGTVLFDVMKISGYRQRYVVDSIDGDVTTDYSQGTCMLLNREMLENVGLFDERFFLYWEEVDLSLRAKNAGYKLVVAKGATVAKRDNSLTALPTCYYYSVRNARLILEKHPDRFTRSGYIWYALRVTGWAVKLLPHPTILLRAIKAILSGLRDGMNKSYGRRTPNWDVIREKKA